MVGMLDDGMFEFGVASVRFVTRAFSSKCTPAIDLISLTVSFSPSSISPPGHVHLRPLEGLSLHRYQFTPPSDSFPRSSTPQAQIRSTMLQLVQSPTGSEHTVDTP